MILSERCRLAKRRYFQNGKEPLVSRETFPEYLNFGNYYFSRDGKPCFSQQTQQMWTVFIYSRFQQKHFPLFEDAKHSKLRQGVLFSFVLFVCFGLVLDSRRSPTYIFSASLFPHFHNERPMNQLIIVE